MKWKQIVVWTSAIHASPGTRVVFAVFWDAQRSNARLKVWVNKQKRTSDHSCSSDEIGRARHRARRTTWFHQRTSSLSHLCSGASNRKDLEMKIKSGSMGQEDDFVLRLTFVFNVHASGWLNSTCDAESFEDEKYSKECKTPLSRPDNSNRMAFDLFVFVRVSLSAQGQEPSPGNDDAQPHLLSKYLFKTIQS